jgi:hypothetical protein
MHFSCSKENSFSRGYYAKPVLLKRFSRSGIARGAAIPRRKARNRGRCGYTGEQLFRLKQDRRMPQRSRRPLMESLEPRLLLTATIDLLALYTPQAQAAMGGVNNVMTRIRADVAAANTALSNSRLDVVYRLVAVNAENYTETGDYGTDLDNLNFVGDGLIDNVIGLRNYFGADSVFLFDSSSDSVNAGISYELDPSSPTKSDDSMGVVDITSPPTDYVLAHELGHTLGAAHAIGDPGGGGATSYAAGYRFTGNDDVLYHDVMAYDPGQVIPYYSNPSILYQGVPIGNATANASATIAQFASTVAGFHATPKVIGNLDTVSTAAITGWMADPKANTSAGTVKILIDGVLRGTVTASNTRSDLLSFLGSTNHGFSFATPTLSTGMHTVAVLGVDLGTGASTLLGAKSINVSNPVGFIDVADATRVAGWGLDPMSPASSVTITVKVDGVTAGTTTASQPRPDLVSRYGSANHGYSFSLAGMAPGIHRVDVFATQVSTGNLTLLGSRVVSTNTAPRGWIDVANSTSVKGWAFSKDVGSGAIQVRYSIDGGAPVFVDANLSRPDLAGPLGSANHGFSIALPQLKAGKHTVRLDAVDTLTRALTPLGTREFTVSDVAGARLPVGEVDIATNGRVAGWLLDPDDKSQAIQVRIDVDGVAGTPFTTDKTRPDLAAPLRLAGFLDFGFDVNPGLAAGNHVIDVYAIDPVVGPVLIARRNTVTAAPRGWVDSLTAGKIQGWAFAAALGGTSAQIRVDVDGRIGSLVTAGGNRPDLAAPLGGTSFGFSLSTANIAAGRHNVRVYVLNPVTDDLALIGARAVVFA